MKSKNIFNKRQSTINTNLAIRQNLTDEDVENIKKLHAIRNCYFGLIEVTDDKSELINIRDIITQIEFSLQKIWGFEEDARYHRFFDIPKCDCPKLDNSDLLGTGHRYINPNCILHGQ